MVTRNGFQVALALGLAVALVVIAIGAAQAAEQQVTLTVVYDAQQGPPAPAEVERILAGLRGVKTATISDGGTEAVVTYDPAHVSVAQMVDALRGDGVNVAPTP